MVRFKWTLNNPALTKEGENGQCQPLRPQGRENSRNWVCGVQLEPMDNVMHLSRKKKATSSSVVAFFSDNVLCSFCQMCVKMYVNTSNICLITALFSIFCMDVSCFVKQTNF